MLLVTVPWCQRRWALPVLSVPTLTPATSAKLGKRHRTTIQAAQLLIWLVRRWVPEREIDFDSYVGFSSGSRSQSCLCLVGCLLARVLFTRPNPHCVSPRPN